MSVIIPVKNEGKNIRRCLEHLQWVDEIFVVDSQSMDNTAEIVQQLNANLIQFHFNGIYPKKKNWSLENLPLRNDWVLIIDADEVVPFELQREITDVVRNPDADGYYLHFAYMFLGCPIKHCGYGSTWVLRLFKHRLGRYEKMPVKKGSRTGDNEAHEHVIFNGNSKRLKTSVLHYAYPTVDTWVEKHNRYSNWEAELYQTFISRKTKKDKRKLDVSIKWKRNLKALYLRMPFRYVLRFIYAYFVRLGFLDGRPGFILCVLLSFYDFLSWAKVQEKRHYTSPQCDTE